MANGLFYFDSAGGPTATPIAPAILDAASEAVTAAGAVSVETYYTTLDTTGGAMAVTLADGKVHGQLKKIQMTVDGTADATLTITSPVSASLNVVVFADIGDTVELIWNEASGYWRILAAYNCADGTSAPAVS